MIQHFRSFFKAPEYGSGFRIQKTPGSETLPNTATNIDLLLLILGLQLGFSQPRLDHLLRFSWYSIFRWAGPTRSRPHSLASGPFLYFRLLPLWGFYVPSTFRWHFSFRFPLQPSHSRGFASTLFWGQWTPRVLCLPSLCLYVFSVVVKVFF